MTRETVWYETPAMRATSLMLGFRPARLADEPAGLLANRLPLALSLLEASAWSAATVPLAPQSSPEWRATAHAASSSQGAGQERDSGSRSDRRRDVPAGHCTARRAGLDR